VGGQAFDPVHKRFCDDSHDAFSVCQNVGIPKSEHTIALRFEKLSSRRIVRGNIAFHVTAAIDLNDQLRFVACKIREIRSDGRLTTEMSGIMAQTPQGR
jgi:hypothetical protein